MECRLRKKCETVCSFKFVFWGVWFWPAPSRKSADNKFTARNNAWWLTISSGGKISSCVGSSGKNSSLSNNCGFSWEMSRKEYTEMGFVTGGNKHTSGLTSTTSTDLNNFWRVFWLVFIISSIKKDTKKRSNWVKKLQMSRSWKS